MRTPAACSLRLTLRLLPLACPCAGSPLLAPGPRPPYSLLPTRSPDCSSCAAPPFSRTFTCLLPRSLSPRTLPRAPQLLVRRPTFLLRQERWKNTDPTSDRIVRLSESKPTGSGYTRLSSLFTNPGGKSGVGARQRSCLPDGQMGDGAANPNPLSLNPNWAQLQQKLKAGRSRPPIPDAGATGKPPSVLGKRKEMSGPEAAASASALSAPPPASEVLKPTSTDCSLTHALAMDCEMVGVGSQGTRSAIGRVTLVNAWGNVVYDEYVRPLERVVDFRTRISGIRSFNLNKAKDFRTAQKEVAEFIKGKILVGHSLHHDLKALLLSHPKDDRRDTSEYKPFFSRDGQTRALRDLASQVLGITIQQGTHCSIEDARAAMLIYQKHKKGWEKDAKKQLKSKKKLKDGRKRSKRKKEPESNDQGVLSSGKSKGGKVT